MAERIRGRLRRQRADADATGEPDALVVEIQPGELRGVFAAPGWLRDLGGMAWLLVGVTLLLVAAVWLLSLIDTIVIPVVTAGIIAAVLSPVVRWLAGHMPRAAAAAIVFLSLVALGLGIGLLVLIG